MKRNTPERTKTRVQYMNGHWAELTESQLAALRKVSGIERLIPGIETLSETLPETLSERPFEATDVRLVKGGKK